jgi:hypothetical protein
MTPKQKAKDLFEIYLLETGNETFAKKCALIAVDEIRDSIIEINEYDYQALEKYWYLVKQELEKI